MLKFYAEPGRGVSYKVLDAAIQFFFFNLITRICAYFALSSGRFQWHNEAFLALDMCGAHYINSEKNTLILYFFVIVF